MDWPETYISLQRQEKTFHHTQQTKGMIHFSLFVSKEVQSFLDKSRSYLHYPYIDPVRHHSDVILCRMLDWKWTISRKVRQKFCLKCRHTFGL